MKLLLEDGLLWTSLCVEFKGHTLALHKILLDTGSAGCVFNADRLSEIGVFCEPSDKLRRIRGVGGVEMVFLKILDAIELGTLRATNFEVEVGELDYGFEIDGILGLDFLLAVEAVIDLGQLKLRRSVRG